MYCPVREKETKFIDGNPLTIRRFSASPPLEPHLHGVDMCGKKQRRSLMWDDATCRGILHHIALRAVAEQQRRPSLTVGALLLLSTLKYVRGAVLKYCDWTDSAEEQGAT